MASVFTRIINGELPARFVYRDDHCVAFLSAAPLKPGHTLVVPIREVDHWIDLDADLSAHVFQTAQKIAAAIQRAFRPQKVALLIVGLEVRHVHLHLVPIDAIGDVDFSRQNQNPDPAEMDAAAQKIRDALTHS
jgi:diadenosine tetraphosphate (Ap4A) HIT family hydrolase